MELIEILVLVGLVGIVVLNGILVVCSVRLWRSFKKLISIGEPDRGQETSSDGVEPTVYDDLSFDSQSKSPFAFDPDLQPDRTDPLRGSFTERPLGSDVQEWLANPDALDRLLADFELSRDWRSHVRTVTLADAENPETRTLKQPVVD